MSAPLRTLALGALLALAGAQAYGNLRQGERFEALSQELSLLREELRAERTRKVPMASTATTSPAPAPAPFVPPEVIAAHVVQLLEQRQLTRPAAQTQAEPSRPLPPPSPEVRTTLDRAQRLADSVLATGIMRPEDAAELREALNRLGPMEEAHAIRQRFIVASNRGQLQLPPGVPPFLL